MKCFKTIFKSFLISTLFILTTPAHLFSTSTYSKNLINEDLSPTFALEELLSEMGIPYPRSYEQLVVVTQDQWIRKAKERWQEELRFTDKKEELLPILEKLGCINQVSASQKHYDYAIVLGASVNGTRPKLIQLIEEYNKGVRFDKVIFLTANWEHDLEREIPAYLDLNQPKLPIKQSWTPPENIPTTEYEITQSIIDQIEFPEGLDPSNFIHIATGNLKDSKNSPRRANTKDTLIALTNHESIENKSCLIFSLQPYIGYQEAIVREVLSKSCEIETVGQACSEDMNVAILLDSVARWIYAEGQKQKIL